MLGCRSRVQELLNFKLKGEEAKQKSSGKTSGLGLMAGHVYFIDVHMPRCPNIQR